MQQNIDERRLYNRTERRMIKAGKREEAKAHWCQRYEAASPEKRAKMLAK